MALADSFNGIKVSLFLNHRCNLRCRYCYNGPSFDRAMPEEIARRAIDFGFAQAGEGFLQLAFFGGEPLLEFDLLAGAVEYARAEGARRRKAVHFSVATNGTVLDERRLKLLKESAFHVQVSLDGGPQAQDANRRFADGGSSWARAAQSLRELQEAGVGTRVVAIVDPANARFLVDSFEALLALGARNIYFAPNLAGDWDDASWAALEEHLALLADRWAGCFRSGQEVRLDPFNGKVISHLVRGSRSPTRCAFGEREFAVSPRGRIYPCDRMVKRDDDEEMCIGDLEQGLDEPKRRRISLARGRVEPDCEACGLLERCMHRCGCTNHELTGDPGGVSPELCRYERLVIAQADRVANALFEERNPAFLRRFYAAARPG